MNRTSDYITKSVPFKFLGKELNFFLSQALFSSFDIDAGSRLLLKTAGQNLTLQKCKSLLDAGCGTGIIGLSVKKAFPDIDVYAQDRDALAVALTEENRKNNQIEGIKTDSCPLLQGLNGRKFDLVLSNLPAKAGHPVLEDFFKTVKYFLTKDGTAAVVIVDTLSDFAETSIKKSGGEMTFTEKTGKYSVFHFKFSKTDKPLLTPPSLPEEDFSCYLRTRRSFLLNKQSYFLNTVYGLPDFDSHSFQIQITADLSEKITGSVLFLNPGQGHIPAWLCSQQNSSIKSIYLASRDILEIKTSQLNIPKEITVKSYPVPYESALRTIIPKDSLNNIIAFYRPITGLNFEKEYLDLLKYLLKPEGRLIVSGKSNDIFRLCRKTPGYTLLKTKKHRGFKGIILKKRG